LTTVNTHSSSSAVVPPSAARSANQIRPNATSVVNRIPAHGVRRTPWVAIIFTTLLAFALIGYADLAALGGTTAFLLLCVFAIVNVAVLVLRRDKVEHKHFNAPTLLPVLGFILCVYLASPLSGRATNDYKIAGWLMVIGVALWLVTWLLNKYVFNRKADFDPTHLDPSGPVN